jgi:hypothetical protein
MTGQACRRKGRDFERKVQRRLARVFGEEFVRRGGQPCDGESVADVSAPGLWIECKAHKRTNPRAALRQALRGAAKAPVWKVAVVKDDRKKPNVMMTFEDFVDLLRAWHSERIA